MAPLHVSQPVFTQGNGRLTVFYNTQIPPSIIEHDVELRHTVGPGYRSRPSSAFVQACGHSRRVTKP